MGRGRSIVTLLVAFALMGVFSLLGQGTRVQQPTYKVSDKLVGGPVGKLSESDRTATIFAMGAKQTESAATVTSLSGAGKVNWSVQLPSNITPLTIYSASLASGRPWLAVALQGGQVYVTLSTPNRARSSAVSMGKPSCRRSGGSQARTVPRLVASFQPRRRSTATPSAGSDT